MVRDSCQPTKARTHSHEWFTARLNWVCLNRVDNKVVQFGLSRNQATPPIVNSAKRSDCLSVIHNDNISEIVPVLKAVAHVDRLVILLELLKGPRSVGDLINVLKHRQPKVSQMLANLRGAGLVKCRRKGKSVFYYIASSETRNLLSFVNFTFFMDSDQRFEPDQVPSK